MRWHGTGFVILGLAIFAEVTCDRQMDGHMITAYTTLAQCCVVKTSSHTSIIQSM